VGRSSRCRAWQYALALTDAAERNCPQRHHASTRRTTSQHELFGLSTCATNAQKVTCGGSVRRRLLTPLSLRSNNHSANKSPKIA
jgi:hypothetical protein